MLRKEVRKPVEIKPEQNKAPVLYILVPREIRDKYMDVEATIYFDDESGIMIVVPKPDASLEEVRTLLT